MPISRLEGLKGINAIAQRMKGFDGLSYQQKREFLAAHESQLGAYTNNSNSLNFIKQYYDNLQFINRFGKQAFQLTGPTDEGAKYRKQLLNQGLEQKKNKLIDDTFESTFGNNQNIQDLRNGLDEQGKYDLLSNTNYLTDSQINNRFKENTLKAKRELKNYDEASKANSWKVDNMGGVGYDLAGSALKANDRLAIVSAPEKSKKVDLENNQNILNKIFSQVQNRRENAVSGLTNNIYQKMLKTGDLKKYYTSFDALASLNSDYYAQFKNSDWLKDYSNTDRLKDYAKFMALSQQYGEGTAIQYLNRSMQNRVAKAQDGKWTGNTLKKVGTTFLSDLGSQVAMMRNADAFFDPEKLGIINQGLDPNSPIYARDKYNNIIKDKQGKPIIVGYNKNTNIWTNPAYWNDMYMYNTTDQNEIELIKQRHGVSKYVNVNPYGYNPNEHMISWGTGQEMIAQSGHLLAAGAETLLLGGIGKALGSGAQLIGRGAMMAAKAANASAKTLNIMSKVGKGISKTSGVANDILMNMAASMNGPQGEAMGTFNEQLEKNTEAVKNQIKKELHDYAKTINYDAPHAKQQIAQYYKQLKLQDIRRQKLGAVEGTKQLPMSDATLIQQAKQLYANDLLKDQESYLERKHQKDYQEAATNAARTYTKNWAADFIKENFITGGVQQYKIAKGALTGALDNSIAKGIIADATTGGVKRAVGKAGEALKNATWKNLAKGTAKQVTGGFTDEFLDGLNADMAEGVGDKSFTDYLNKNYDSKAYNATVHGAFANVIAGIDGFVGGLADRENWYEGLIGAGAPFVSGGVNMGYGFHPRDNSRALFKGVDEYGNKLDVAERLSRVITNPILEEHANAKNQDRAIDRRIKEINDLVAQNKTTLNDAAKAMSALRDYSTPFNINRYRDKDGVGASILDSEDNKLYNVFTLMDLMHTLKSVEGGTKSQLYQDVMGNMKGLAEGTLSDDEMNSEIDKFLADDNNKSVLDKPDKREIAAERLQKNAKYFMDAYKRYEDIDNTLSRSSLLKNADPRLLSLLRYNLMAKDNYKERLKQIEDDLGVGHTDGESKDYTANLANLYGSKSARENALKARERSLATIETAQKENIEANNKALSKRDALQAEVDNAKDEDAKKEAQNKLNELNNRIASRKFQNKSLDTQKSILLEEKQELEQIIKDDSNTILSVDGILGMNASNRAAVLDERNKNNYTEFQQGIIEKAREKLKAKDPEALQKIHDAGILHDRIASSNTVYNKLLDNADLATTWLDAQEAIRDRRAMEEKLERDIESGYNKLNDAYDTSDPTALRNTSLGFDSQLLNAYMNDNPDKAAKVKPYYDMRKFFDDAAAIIMGKDGDLVTKRIQLGNLETMLYGANSVEDISRNIEKVIDDPNIDEGNKAFFDNLLNEMQKLNYQRDKTTLENRKERLKREAEEKAKREAEEARKQAEAQAAAEAAAKAKEEAEAKAKADAETKAQAEAEAKRAAEEAASNSQEGLSEEDKEKAAEVAGAVPKQEVPDNAAETVGAEQKGDTMPVSWANGLMDSNAEEGSASAGEMWHRTEAGPRKEAVTANLKVDNNGKRTITFSNGNQGEELVIGPKDYEVEASAQQKPTETSNKEQGKEDNEQRKEAKEQRKEERKEETKEKKAEARAVENRPFHAKSLEKEGEDWYFVGNFEGDNKETRVKVSKDFNLDIAINEQRKQREKLYYKQGSIMDVQIEEDSDGNVYGVNSTLEDQKNDMPDSMKGTIIEENSTDTDVQANVRGEEQQDNSATQLSGYPMAIWNRESLQGNERALVRDKDTKHPYSRDKLNAWLDSRGIHLRDIIDHELADILSVNPHAKVKFMATNSKDFPKTREHKDDTVSNNLFMVLDYDDNINRGITQIHDDKKNGGVIETADGKKYLIIGVLAYKNGNTAQQALYNNLWGAATNSEAGTETKKRKQKAFGADDPRAKDGFGMIRQERDAYFPHHTKEVFYVSPNFSTEIVPYSLIPGWNVHRMENDTEEQHRSVIELMNDEKRNPYHITLDNASWAIQEESQFLIVSPKDVNQEEMSVMAPSNKEKNMGAAFILFPAANGRMFCGHIDACFYGDMKEGSLKEKADKLLNDLTSSDYDTRVEAIKGLYHIFYFSNKKDMSAKKILTNKRGEVTFKNEDDTNFYSVTLGANFNREKFIQKFIEFKPRVNITPWVLSNKESIEEYSEAGALNTDLAQLALAGSSYGVYSVNVDGTINKPSEIANPVTQSKGKDYGENRTNVIYYTDGKLSYYKYDKISGEYYLNGNLVDKTANTDLIKDLEYNRMVVEGKIAEVTKEKNYRYYIIRDTDNPLVIKINDSNYHVTELSAEESKAFIDKVNKDKEAKARDKAAQQTLEEIDKADEVDLGTDGTTSTDEVVTPEDGLIYNPETGGLTDVAEQEKLKKQEEEEKKREEEQQKEDKLRNNTPKDSVTQSTTQTFKELIKNTMYYDRIKGIIDKKSKEEGWGKVPKNPKKLAEYLQKHNVEVMSIGTSKEDIETWIDTLENCK